ncbi:MAG: hypothetical protein ACUVUC_07410 [Thermoguttaceae bacterium]
MASRARSLAQREKIVRILQPRSRDAADAPRIAPGPVNPTAQPRSAEAPGSGRPPVNIVDLPEAPAEAS